MVAMRDSRMDPAWIERQVARNPIRQMEDGMFRTCPVRLAFPNVFKVQSRKRDDSEEVNESYNTTLLFPPGANEQIDTTLWQAWVTICKAKFPKNWGADGAPFGLHWPMHDCKDNQQYTGYTPGLRYVACNSRFKPQVVDAAMNPIVDESRVYPGVWAIVKLNLYTYENRKKGAGFGLQNIMIIGDDTKLAGGGSDPKKDFDGVSVDAAYDTASMFGGPGPVPPAPPPPAPPTGYAPPPPPPSMAMAGYDPIND